MFTGIISAVGHIQSAVDQADGLHLTVATPSGFLEDVAIGDSIAIQGACMTVTQIVGEAFSLDVSRESLNKTVGLDQVGPVNLEKAMRLSDRLGGHLVSGHVDGVGTVQFFSAVDRDPNGSWLLSIKAPKELAVFLAYKGSIVVNGVSLTVNQVDDAQGSATSCAFHINLIPHTLQHTTLGKLHVGNSVNLEVDLIARYVARMLESKAGLS